MNFLAGDLGGTKTLLALYEWDDKLIKKYHKRYKSSDWDSFKSIICDFIDNLPNNFDYPLYGCIAVAGRVSKNSCKITNLGWEISAQEISKLLHLKSFELINDFSVLLYGIKHFNSKQFITIQNNSSGESTCSGSSVAVLGAGTGLGIAKGLITSNEIIVFPSEGGHIEFSPRTQKEWEIANWLKKDLGLNRLSLEKVVSGNGLGNIARWRLSQDDCKDHALRHLVQKPYKTSSISVDIPSIASQLAQEGDKTMLEVLNIWLSAYGSAAGDIALQELCEGGLWIAGGTASKHIKGIKSDTFLESFKNKGRFRSFIEKLPVMALIDPEAGLFSAGCRAHQLSINMGDLSE